MLLRRAAAMDGGGGDAVDGEASGARFEWDEDSQLYYHVRYPKCPPFAACLLASRAPMLRSSTLGWALRGVAAARTLDCTPGCLGDRLMGNVVCLRIRHELRALMRNNIILLLNKP